MSDRVRWSSGQRVPRLNRRRRFHGGTEDRYWGSGVKWTLNKHSNVRNVASSSAGPAKQSIPGDSSVASRCADAERISRITTATAVASANVMLSRPFSASEHRAVGSEQYSLSGNTPCFCWNPSLRLKKKISQRAKNPRRNRRGHVQPIKFD